MIDPIAIRIGAFELHWYGIIIASAIMAAAIYGTYEVRRRGEDADAAWSMLLWVILGGVVGARVYHVIHEWSAIYSKDPALIVQVWRGGLGIPGAIAGGAAVLWYYTRRTGMATGGWLDIFAMSIPLGQAIGRLGNFVNQELYGPPTTLPWGIPIDAAHRIGAWTDLNAFPATTRFHPLFAYEALLSLATLTLLFIVSRRFASRLFDGDLLLIYLMSYGASRAYLETFRVENWTIGGLPTAIWLGLAAILLAGGFLVLRHLRGWGTPGAWMARREAADAAAAAKAAGAGDAGSEATAEANPG